MGGGVGLWDKGGTNIQHKGGFLQFVMDEGNRLRHGFVEQSIIPDMPDFFQSDGDVKRDGSLILRLAGSY